jgi:hypothetical protein
MGFTQSHHHHNGMEWDDAYQAASVGLLQAYKDFDPELASKKGDPFCAYASTKIRFEIHNEMRRNRWFSGIPKDFRAYPVPLGVIFLDDAASGPDARAKEDPVFDDVAQDEWVEGMDKKVANLDIKRRNIYQGVMLHDGHGPKDTRGPDFQDYWGIGPEWLSMMRKQIRGRLKDDD